MTHPNTQSASVKPKQSPLTGPAKNIVLIASGKGGVGKTWFSISLAHALGAAGKKALIFDGDLGLANIDIQLGLNPKNDLATVMEGACTFKETITSYKTNDQKVGFDVIAGRSGSGQLSDLTPERLALVREELKIAATSYDYVLIDLGAGIGGIVKSLTPAASRCLLVLNDEPTSLTDAYAFLKVTRKNQPHLEIQVLVNAAETLHQGEQTYEGFKNVCGKFLNYEPGLAGVIRRDTLIKDAIRHQTPLMVRHPNAKALLDVKGIRESLFR